MLHLKYLLLMLTQICHVDPRHLSIVCMQCAIHNAADTAKRQLVAFRQIKGRNAKQWNTAKWVQRTKYTILLCVRGQLLRRYKLSPAEEDWSLAGQHCKHGVADGTDRIPACPADPTTPVDDRRKEVRWPAQQEDIGHNIAHQVDRLHSCLCEKQDCVALALWRPASICVCNIPV